MISCKLNKDAVVQEPAFQELILFYIENNGERETPDQAEMPSLQIEIYEKIPIPDLPVNASALKPLCYANGLRQMPMNNIVLVYHLQVVFPHKKLSFRILDAVCMMRTSLICSIS